MASSISIKEQFADVIQTLGIFTGGRETVAYDPITTDEKQAIERFFNYHSRILYNISPKIANLFNEHKSAVLKFAGVAKGLFTKSKPIKYPAESGTIGIDILMPYFIKYTASPSSSAPAYTDYTNNTWDLSLTAGTDVYFLGSSSNWYKANPQDDQNMMLVIFKDGVLEVGTTPKIDQMRIVTEINQKYSPWVVNPLVEIPVEEGKTIYQYNTLGILPVYPDLGVKWYAMPKYSGTSTIKLLGVVFYEYDGFSDTKYIS